MTELHLATINELIEEIARRSKSLLLVGEFPVDGHPHAIAVTDRLHGDLFTPFGLLRHAQELCEKHYRRATSSGRDAP